MLADRHPGQEAEALFDLDQPGERPHIEQPPKDERRGPCIGQGAVRRHSRLTWEVRFIVEPELVPQGLVAVALELRPG